MAENANSAPAEQAGALPLMTGAELRVIREALGLSTRWLAGHLGVDERTVSRWEHTYWPIPDDVVETVRELERHAAGVIERAAAALLDAPAPILGVPRTGDMDGWPASWWRAVAAAVTAEVPGLRVVYRDDQQ